MLNPVAPLRLCCLLGMALLPEGCTSQPAAFSAAEAEVSRRHAESVLREARNEAAMLRHDIAATRIAAAKKDAELEELRLRVAELRQREADLRQKRTDQQQMLEAKQTECAALRAEHDRLLQPKAEFQVQFAEVPHLRQVAAEARATEAGVQVRINALESAVAGLKAELDQVKRNLGRTRAKPGAKPRRPAEAAEPAPPARRP